MQLKTTQHNFIDQGDMKNRSTTSKRTMSHINTTGCRHFNCSNGNANTASGSILINPNKIRGFNLSDPDNYDLNIILILSNYFHNVSLEYFSRILHNYATDLLNNVNIPELEKHYYYRSCMNIYAACLYQMFSARLKEELAVYIKQKKNFLNLITKFDIYLNKKQVNCFAELKTGVSHKSANHSKLSATTLKHCKVTKKANKAPNPILLNLQKKISQSEPKFSDFKLLRYQSHILGNIAELNILDYLFINYINTPKFHANLRFVSHCFKSSFNKLESLIKNKSCSNSASPVARSNTRPSSPVDNSNFTTPLKPDLVSASGAVTTNANASSSATATNAARCPSNAGPRITRPSVVSESARSNSTTDVSSVDNATSEVLN